MQTLQPPYNPSYSSSAKSSSIMRRFSTWCYGQEKYRFGWLAIIITIHGCILTPITILSITLGGNNFVFWGVAIGAMAMSLVTNLAAMSTRVTIPVFFFSVLLDLLVIVSALVSIA